MYFYLNSKMWRDFHLKRCFLILCCSCLKCMAKMQFPLSVCHMDILHPMPCHCDPELNSSWTLDFGIHDQKNWLILNSIFLGFSTKNLIHLEFIFLLISGMELTKHFQVAREIALLGKSLRLRAPRLLSTLAAPVILQKSPCSTARSRLRWKFDTF